jgi:hypothetical protein
MDMIRELECNDPETYREIQMEIAKHVNRAIEKVLGAES